MLDGSPMFERFTNRARHVVVLAQEEARRLQHNYIGTEHLLLGLLGEPRRSRPAHSTTSACRWTPPAKTSRPSSAPGKVAQSGHIPFTPRAKKTLELALREALQLHHNYIGTEHILLGVIREGDGVGAQVLKQYSPDLMAIRMAVLNLVSARANRGSTRSPMAAPPPLRGRTRRIARAWRAGGAAHDARRRHQPDRSSPPGRITAGRLAPPAARRPCRRRHCRRPGARRTRR